MKFKAVLLKNIGYLIPLLTLTAVYIKQIDVNSYDLKGAYLIALLFILFGDFKINKILNISLKTILVFFFNFFTLIEVCHYHIFKYSIKASTFFIILDSNINEAGEFFTMYFDTFVSFTIILFVIGLIIHITANIKCHTPKSLINNKLKIILALFLIFHFSKYKTRSHTIPYIIFSSYNSYVKEKEKMNSVYLNKYGGKFSNVKHKTLNQEETYILIIGESTTRNKMSLYNYYRNTNPELNKIKKNLIIYKDVISPHTHTIPALEKALTLASNVHPEKKYEGTFLQLFNIAEFETYWISNQNPLGNDETQTTIISKSADKRIFVNTTDYRGNSLDERVLQPFERILKQDHKKKLIVIHLMGTHAVYSKRYPLKFNRFTNTPKTIYNSATAHKMINDYDNSVLYNDYIVSKIIKKAKKTNSASFVLYFSDHGEDVFETLNSASHSEEKGTKPMHDIPFILWMSEKYKENLKDKLVFDVDRKYSTENLIYSLSDLSNIKFDEFIASKSIVNKNFKKEKRIILKDKDYDEIFK